MLVLGSLSRVGRDGTTDCMEITVPTYSTVAGRRLSVVAVLFCVVVLVCIDSVIISPHRKRVLPSDSGMVVVTN